ncbi:MAG: cation:proton antiporter [Armatimonadota bacterium]
MGHGEEVQVEQAIILLLMIVSAVAVVARRLKLPYTVALVVAGLALGFAPIDVPLRLTDTVLIYVLLPALLFEGAINLHLGHLRRDLVPIVVFAVPGTLVCVGIVGTVMHYLLDLDWIHALLFGALISPTDPISVLSVFKRLGVGRRLSVIVEGESMFNDAIAIVIFRLLLAAAARRAAHLPAVPAAHEAIAEFVLVACGGLAVGLAAGVLMSYVTRQIDDHLVEITLSGILAYGSFLAAEQIHVSGPIAVIVAGIVLRNYGWKVGMSATTRLGFRTFWEYAGFVVNSVVFLLVGLGLQGQLSWAGVYRMLAGFLVVILARAIVIYGSSALLSMGPLGHRLPRAWRHVIVWSGLKGALCMVLALTVRQYDEEGVIISTSFGVVLLSLLVQTLTMKPLCRAFGVGRAPKELTRNEVLSGRLMAQNAALAALRHMRESGGISGMTYGALRRQYERDRDHLETELSEVHAEQPQVLETERAQAMFQAASAEKSSILEAFHSGAIGEEALNQLLQDVDQRLDALAGEDLEE